jgi:hypothetical protein
MAKLTSPFFFFFYCFFFYFFYCCSYSKSRWHLGKEDVISWRRSWDARPPPMTKHPFYHSFIKGAEDGHPPVFLFDWQVSQSLPFSSTFAVYCVDKECHTNITLLTLLIIIIVFIIIVTE